MILVPTRSEASRHRHMRDGEGFSTMATEEFEGHRSCIQTVLAELDDRHLLVEVVVVMCVNLLKLRVEKKEISML